jgi:hypothetical protein
MYDLVRNSGASAWDLLPTEIISSGVDLYLAGGFERLFRRVHEGSAERFDNSWLYVPSGTIKPPQETLEEGTGAMPPQDLGDAIPMDDQRLYPLFLRGRTIGILVASGVGAPSGETAERLLARIARFVEPDRPANDLAHDFLKQLFHRDNSPQEFYRRLLSWLTDLWPRSFAGVYVETQGTFILRTSVGNIDRCYRLPREMSVEAAEQFLASSDITTSCVPLDTLPDHPIFLDAPPDMLFVHAGIGSACVRQLIAVAGPGDADSRTCRQLLELGALTSSLNENQFASAGGLLSFYARLAREELTGFDTTKLFTDLYEHISQQLDLSEMSVVLLDDKRRLSVTMKLPGNVPETPEHYPEAVVAHVLAGEPYHLADINSDILSVDQARSRYFANVKSESYLPLRDPKGVSGLVTFGSPVTGSYLADHEELLFAVANFVAFYVGRVKSLDNDALLNPSTPGAAASPADLARRLLMVHKLSDGCLHDMSDSLSVILGQAEIARSAAEESTQNDLSYLSHLHRVARAAESMSGRLEALRQICACSKLAQSAKIDGAKFLRDLPIILSGLARQVRDTKNIEVSVAVMSRELPQVQFSSAMAFDVFLPVLITLMENAVCSGQIKVSTETGPGFAALALNLAHRLVAQTDLPALLNATFADQRPFSPEESADLIRLGSVSVGAETLKQDTIRVTIRQLLGAGGSHIVAEDDRSHNDEGQQ